MIPSRITLLGLLLVLSARSSGRAQAPIESKFDASSEGWLVAAMQDLGSGVPDSIAQSLAPEWVSAAGGGFIRNNSQPSGTTAYWSAPSVYCGDKSVFVGGVLQFQSFDSPNTNAFAREDIILKGAGRTLVFGVDQRPGPEWQVFTIPLNAGLWRVGVRTGPIATQGDLNAVLSDLAALYIRAEFQLGPDTRGLDNVLMTCAPVIVEPPLSESVCPVGQTTLSVTAAGSDLTYQWQAEETLGQWLDLSGGVFSYPGGSVFFTGENAPDLHITLNASPEGSGVRLRCTVSNSCGSAISEPATLVPCRSDLTCDNVVDDDDFVVFAAAYNLLDCADPAMAGGCPADLDGDGLVDDADFVLFVAAYNNLGCLGA